MRPTWRKPALYVLSRAPPEGQKKKIMRHGPSATHSRAREVAGLCALSVNYLPSALNCSISSLGFRRLPTWRIMATRHPRRPLTQRPRIRRLWGLTTQVGGARLIIERCTKFTSLGDSRSTVTDFEVDQNAKTFENFHCKHSDHGQGAFASSWRAGSELDWKVFFPLWFRANFNTN